MRKILFFAVSIVLTVMPAPAAQQPAGFRPVTSELLTSPSPDDWLMYSRTYDAQRYSPLDQINAGNVGRLTEAWTTPLPTGVIEIIPIVHDGVMYALVPGRIENAARTSVLAIDGANGSLLWEYVRPTGGVSRGKSLAIFEDMVIFASADNYIVALDARSGDVRWETQSTGGLTAGVLVFDGKVISGRTCTGNQANCYIAAHDARNGEELWRFYTAAGADDPIGGDTWGDAPEASRSASTWGLGGSYDPVRRIVYWGVANPTPNTRSARHGDIDAIPRTAPSNLYSNSTVALDIDTGALLWYYQHLPGDDWDQDYTNERILLRTPVSADPRFVKWINPDIPAGEVRDVVVNVGEGGGIFALDGATGQFLWANPFPYDVPNFLISDIDPRTGATSINWDVVLKEPGERHVICAYNTKSYWPMSYHPGRNALYIPYVDTCLDMTRAAPAPAGAQAAGAGQRGGGGTPERRVGIPRPDSDPEKFAGIAKVDMSTGEIERIYESRVPGNGATLATAGDLIFWGDLDQKFKALDADTGAVLWEARLGGPIQNSTITYRANGKQYVAVLTGQGLMTAGLYPLAGIQPETANGIHAFALPD